MYRGYLSRETNTKVNATKMLIEAYSLYMDFCVKIKFLMNVSEEIDKDTFFFVICILNILYYYQSNINLVTI